jgi:hypothetical protein
VIRNFIRAMNREKDDLISFLCHHLHEQRCSSMIEKRAGKRAGNFRRQASEISETRTVIVLTLTASSLPVVSRERTHALCP